MTELIRLLFVSDTFILRVSINLCLNQHIIPSLFVAVFYHLLKLRAVVCLGRDGTVNVVLDDGDAILFRIGHIAIVCGFWQGASGGAHPVFVAFNLFDFLFF